MPSFTSKIKPFTVENRERDRFDVEVFGFDLTLAPEGKTVVKVVLDSNHNFWKELSTNPEKYSLEKQKVADLLDEKLEKRFPTFKNKIEYVDVVTAISVEHWTGSYHGYQAWGAPKEYDAIVRKNGVSKTLPGLKNFYMVGQWAGGAIGLNTVCLMGRNLVKGLCKKDNRKFKTSNS